MPHDGAAVAQMRDDDPPADQFGSRVAQLVNDRREGEAVKAPPADALQPKVVRQPEALGDPRPPPVEGRIEAADLRQVGPKVACRPHRGQVARQMQRPRA